MLCSALYLFGMQYYLHINSFGLIYISRNPRIYQRREHCTGEELVWVPRGRILQPALQILSCWCCSSRDQDGTMGPNSCPLPRSPPASGGLPNIWLWKIPIASGPSHFNLGLGFLLQPSPISALNIECGETSQSWGTNYNWDWGQSRENTPDSISKLVLLQKMKIEC